MGVSRSGYYKYLNRRNSDTFKSRMFKHKIARALVTEIHSKHPSHGYRWIAAYIRINTPFNFSDSLVYKTFRYLGIESVTRHKRKSRKRKVKDKYPNLIFSTWSTVDRPRQVIVSDMTALKVNGRYYELTMYFDVFTKQILSWKLADRRGAREPYLYGLQEVLDLLESDTAEDPTYLHTDQGSVYASIAFNKLATEKNIIRSMSRAGKPTDNPVNEALNGWIKEELYLDFRIHECSNSDNGYFIRERIGDYVSYYNEERPCFAIGYDTPDNYYNRFQNGSIERKDTFESRFENEEPLDD